MSGDGPPSRTRSSDPGRTAADELERDYDRLEPEILRTVRGKLAATGAPCDDQTLAASYNQAWHALYTARAANEEIANHAGFLVQVTYRRALDEHRAARRRDVGELAGTVGEAVDPELERRLDDRLRVRALMQGMRERLDGRELRAATLCYVHGYTRPEAARALGVRPRRFEKVMDRVSKELSGLVGELREGDWCESRRSLIGAYALGVLDPDGTRHRLATAHLDDCPACRRRVLCMRGLASVVPPAPLLLAALPSAGGAGSALAESWTWLTRADGRVAEIAAGGAAVAVATSAFVVLGPPGDQATPPSPAPTIAAPLPASSSPKLREDAARSVARARAAIVRRRQRRVERVTGPSVATPSRDPAPAPAQATPPLAGVPAPTAPPASTPAGDGWEEFELRR